MDVSCYLKTLHTFYFCKNLNTEGSDAIDLNVYLLYY